MHKKSARMQPCRFFMHIAQSEIKNPEIPMSQSSLKWDMTVFKELPRR
jgi:hypothetical protein